MSIVKEILKEYTINQKNPLFQDKKVEVKSAGHKGNGLFTTVDIKKDEMVLMSKVTIMTDEDWDMIKDTAPVKLYGFRWDDEHAIPLGRWKFNFKNIKDRLLWKKTNFYKQYCHDGLRLSGFLFVNDIDTNTTANVEEVFNIPKNIIGIKAIRDIKAGEELIKEYNYDWKEEFKSWRKGILEGLNLPKKQIQHGDSVKLTDDAPEHFKFVKNKPWVFDRYIDDQNAIIKFIDGANTGSNPVDIRFIKKSLSEGLNLQKLTPELWLKQLLLKLDRVVLDRDPDSEWFHINNIPYFEYIKRSENIWVSNKYVADVMIKTFNMKYPDVDNVVKDVFEQVFGLPVRLVHYAKGEINLKNL